MTTTEIAREIIASFDGIVNGERSDTVWMTIDAEFPTTSDRESALEALSSKGIDWDRRPGARASVNVQLPFTGRSW